MTFLLFYFLFEIFSRRDGKMQSSTGATASAVFDARLHSRKCGGLLCVCFLKPCLQTKLPMWNNKDLNGIQINWARGVSVNSAESVRKMYDNGTDMLTSQLGEVEHDVDVRTFSLQLSSLCSYGFWGVSVEASLPSEVPSPVSQNKHAGCDPGKGEH